MILWGYPCKVRQPFLSASLIMPLSCIKLSVASQSFGEKSSIFNTAYLTWSLSILQQPHFTSLPSNHKYFTWFIVGIVQMGKQGRGQPRYLPRVTELLSDRQGIWPHAACLAGLLPRRKSLREEVAIKPGLEDLARCYTGQPFPTKSGKDVPN